MGVERDISDTDRCLETLARRLGHTVGRTSVATAWERPERDGLSLSEKMFNYFCTFVCPRETGYTICGLAAETSTLLVAMMFTSRTTDTASVRNERNSRRANAAPLRGLFHVYGAERVQ